MSFLANCFPCASSWHCSHFSGATLKSTFFGQSGDLAQSAGHCGDAFVVEGRPDEVQPAPPGFDVGQAEPVVGQRLLDQHTCRMGRIFAHRDPERIAALAGLREGDIITKVDGTAINQNNSLTSVLDKHKVGDKVALTIVRGSKTQTIDVTLGSAPTSS